MNTNMKKLSFALVGLAMAGAAHASTVPVTGTVNVTSTPTTNFFSNSNYAGSGSTSYYELTLPSGGAGTDLNIGYYGTLPNGSGNPNQPVTYAVYAASLSGGQATLGTQAGTTTLSPSSTSWLLTLAAGTQYVLEVILNSATQSTSALISGTVSAVPLPGTALLFGTALLGGIGFMRRRDRKGGNKAAAA